MTDSDKKQEPPKATGEPAAAPDTTDDLEKISHPVMGLYRHTILRGANFGSVVSLLVAPPYLWFRGVRNPKEFLMRTGSITAKGTALGMLLGIVGTIYFSQKKKSEVDYYYDRCYRLRYNTGQVRTDKFSYGGIVLGGLGGVALGMGGGPVVGAIQGASIGVGLAVPAHVLTKKKEKK